MAFQLHVPGSMEHIPFLAQNAHGMGQALPPLANFSASSSSVPSPPISTPNTEVTSPQPQTSTTPPAGEYNYYAQVQSPTNHVQFEKGKFKTLSSFSNRFLDENSKQSDLLDEVHYNQSSPESVTVKSEHSTTSGSTEQDKNGYQVALPTGATQQSPPAQLYSHHQPYPGHVLTEPPMMSAFDHAHFNQQGKKEPGSLAFSIFNLFESVRCPKYTVILTGTLSLTRPGI